MEEESKQAVKRSREARSRDRALRGRLGAQSQREGSLQTCLKRHIHQKVDAPFPERANHDGGSEPFSKVVALAFKHGG